MATIGNRVDKAVGLFRAIFISDRRWPWGSDRLRRPLQVAMFALLILTPVLTVLATIVSGYFDLSILNPTENKDRNLDLFDVVQRAQRGVPSPLNDEIIIIDLRDTCRADIAAAVKVLLTADPSVIGLDMVLDGSGCAGGRDTAGTEALLDLIRADDRLVLGYDLHDTAGTSALRRERPGQLGYVNLHVSDELSTVRSYPALHTVGSTVHYSFAAQLAKAHAPERWLSLLGREMDFELFHFVPVRDAAPAFPLLAFPDLAGLDSLSLQRSLRGKVLIVADRGVCPPDDLHYSPLNPVLSGHAAPDMQGSELHARFLDNLLKGRLLDALPWYWTLLLALFLELFLCLILVPLHDNRKRLYVLVKIPMMVLMSFGVYVLASLLLDAGIAISIALFLIPIWLTGEAMDILEVLKPKDDGE